MRRLVIPGLTRDPSRCVDTLPWIAGQARNDKCMHVDGGVAEVLSLPVAVSS